MRVFILFFVLVCGLVGSPSLVAQSSCNQEGKRFALVIGNQIYQDFGSSKVWIDLKTPHNDAEEMVWTLQRLDFDVTLVKDADIGQMNSVIEEFFKSVVDEHATTLFYFSGHGSIDNNGESLLVPVRMPLKPVVEEETEKYEANDVYRLGNVLKKTPQGKCNTNIVIIDACRTITGSIKSGGGDSEYFNNLNRPGLLMAFASAPGQKSSEGLNIESKCRSKQTNPDKTEPQDNNKCTLSLYTHFLLENLPHHGPYHEVFENTRRAVLNYLNTEKGTWEGSQMPWEGTSLLVPFYFVSPKLSGGFQ